ncbi:MAG: hypothetical protein ABIF88_03280 [archaeon]
MKKNIIYAIIIGLVLVIAIILIILEMNKDEELKFEDDDDLIGGERDSHGCLGPAGYSWNETEKECVREWETGEARYQVVNFQSCEFSGYPIMESYPRQCVTPSGKVFVEEV